MIKKYLLPTSIFINILLVSVIAYKVYNNWFEGTVLKLKFRENIFRHAPVKSGLIYFIGDSHTEAFELNEYLQNPLVRNRGIWGDSSDGVLKRVDEIASTQPQKIFLMIGVNDISNGVTPSAISNNVNSIILKIRQLSPYTAIYIQSVLPTDVKIHKSKLSAFNNIVVLNGLYKDVCIKNKVTFINLFPSFVKNESLNIDYSFDRLHLNGSGYELWASLIKKYL